MMKMTLIIYRILQIPAFINVHCQTNKHKLHLCDQYYLEATFTVPEVWSENSICIFIATQREWAYDVHSTCSEPVLFLQPQKENPACVWRKFPQRGDYFVSPERGFFSFKTMRLCFYYSPSPRRNRPHSYCEGEVRKVHCCIKPEFREALLWVTLPEQHSARLTVNNDFLFDRVCRKWKRESHIWISLGCDAVICHSRGEKVVLVCHTIMKFLSQQIYK